MKKSEMKREVSPFTPYKRKAKGKETRPGYFGNPPRPRARTRAYARTRYAEAKAAAMELIDILGGNVEKDHATWAYYCYHHDIEILMDKAHELASRFRQGELRNPVTAFQKWLQRNFASEG